MSNTSADTWVKLHNMLDRKDEDRHRAFCEFIESDTSGKLRVVLHHLFEDLRDATEAVLCNYEYMIDGRGNRHNMDELWVDLSEVSSVVYEKYVGKRYEPEICRLADLREERGMAEELG